MTPERESEIRHFATRGGNAVDGTMIPGGGLKAIQDLLRLVDVMREIHHLENERDIPDHYGKLI